MRGRAYVEFAPLNEDAARRLIDGLRWASTVSPAGSGEGGVPRRDYT
jgi:hypothetical protein